MTKSQQIDLLNGKVSSLEADNGVLSAENTNLKMLVETLRVTVLKLQLRMEQMEAKMIEKNIDVSSTWTRNTFAIVFVSVSVNVFVYISFDDRLLVYLILSSFMCVRISVYDRLCVSMSIVVCACISGSERGCCLCVYGTSASGCTLSVLEIKIEIIGRTIPRINTFQW